MAYGREITKVELEPGNTPQGIIALAFARAIVAGQYQDAYDMLSGPLRTSLSPAALKQGFEAMIEYAESPPALTDVIIILNDWPAKQKDDVGWAYVSISGNGFAEAVAVVVATEENRQVIRELEWGRP